ncbi:MAG: NifU N-terminal domain-containing protein [Elusimicrobia bacterium]|nr:NifU N-terminal domain-containing protein [Elusimicrobiota bacterium]
MNPLRITAAVSPSDPRVCAFILDRSIFSGSVLCRNADEARGTPLFERLFALPGVVQVWVAGDRVTVAYGEAPPWEIAAKTVGKILRATLAEMVFALGSKIGVRRATSQNGFEPFCLRTSIRGWPSTGAKRNWWRSATVWRK